MCWALPPLLGPSITVRIRTVTGTPARPTLARACARAPGSYSEPSSRWIAHFRARRSDVELDPSKHEAGARRRKDSGMSTFDLKQTATTPVSATSCHIVEHLH
jgi:hypothetical protein